MNMKLLSNTYQVRRLTPADISSIYDLSIGNEIFYRYHPPFVTKESILEDMAALPPRKKPDDKFYIGFFENETLVAIMDLILGYPAEETAFIGLFMMHSAYQNQGIGSKIIEECATYLQTEGYRKIRLGVDRGNPQSSAFWTKNGFTVTDESKYIFMESDLNLSLKDSIIPQTSLTQIQKHTIIN